jgi:hypothetical protein
MKPSSMHLLSMSLALAALVPSMAEAGWRDRYIPDDGWYGMPYPPAYVRPRTVYVYPDRGWNGPVIVHSRGRVLLVDPEADDGYAYSDALPDEGPAYGPQLRVAPGYAAPSSRRGRAAQRAKDAASTPAVAPALATPTPRSVKVIGVKPPDGTPVAALPPPKPAALPDQASSAGAEPPPPKVAQAIALPVPRPNLEGMDFAPSAAAQPTITEPGEDRR